MVYTRKVHASRRKHDTILYQIIVFPWVLWSTRRPAKFSCSPLGVCKVPPNCQGHGHIAASEPPCLSRVTFELVALTSRQYVFPAKSANQNVSEVVPFAVTTPFVRSQVPAAINIKRIVNQDSVEDRTGVGGYAEGYEPPNWCVVIKSPMVRGLGTSVRAYE
jgi:hypothetical protein